MKRVAMIGSRRVNDKQFSYMTSVAKAFAKRNWVICTGCAEGADYASMLGADKDHLDVYLPWKSYNSHIQDLVPARYVTFSKFKHQEWIDSVHKYHPAPERLSRGAMSLHARNFGILNGVDAVVAMPISDTDTGGTGQGMRIARELGIPLFVVCKNQDRQDLKEFIMTKA